MNTPPSDEVRRHELMENYDGQGKTYQQDSEDPAIMLGGILLILLVFLVVVAAIIIYERIK